MSIITYPLNNIMYNATDAETYLCSRTSGVFSSENCFKATATGTNRDVTISKGLAWIKNDDFTGKSICNTDNVTIEIPVSNGNLPRIDRIVLRFDSNANESTIALKQGNPASNPQVPEISRTPTLYELALCDINIPAGSIFVLQGDITSKLLDETVCGLMSDGVNKIPSQALLEQFQNDFNEWFKNIQAQLSGDVAANLQNQIDEINRTISSYDTKYILSTAKGTPSGVATLDNMGKVPQSQLPTMDFIPTNQKGANNGVASLDEDGKLSESQIPDNLQRIPQYKKIVQDELEVTTEDNTEYYLECTKNIHITWGKANCHGFIINKIGGDGGGGMSGEAPFLTTPPVSVADITISASYICNIEFSQVYDSNTNVSYIIWHNWQNDKLED